MFESDPYTEPRWVACRYCDEGGDHDVHMVSYADVEVGEWQCKNCGAYNEYRAELASYGVDEWFDRQREEGLV